MCMVVVNNITYFVRREDPLVKWFIVMSTHSQGDRHTTPNRRVTPSSNFFNAHRVAWTTTGTWNLDWDAWAQHASLVVMQCTAFIKRLKLHPSNLTPHRLDLRRPWLHQVAFSSARWRHSILRCMAKINESFRLAPSGTAAHSRCPLRQLKKARKLSKSVTKKKERFRAWVYQSTCNECDQLRSVLAMWCNVATISTISSRAFPLKSMKWDLPKRALLCYTPPVENHNCKTLCPLSNKKKSKKTTSHSVYNVKAF